MKIYGYFDLLRDLACILYRLQTLQLMYHLSIPSKARVSSLLYIVCIRFGEYPTLIQWVPMAFSIDKIGQVVKLPTSI